MEPFQGSSHRAYNFRLTLVLATLAAALLSTIFVAGLDATRPDAAHADPTLAEAKRQIDDLTEKMVVANEDYNRIRDSLEASKTRQEQLQVDLSAEEDRFNQLQSEVGEIGAVAYEAGPLSNVNAMLTSKSPQALVDQLTYLNLLTSQRQDSIDELANTRDALRTTKKQVDQEVGNQAEQEAQLRQQKDQLQADLDKWKGLRDKLSPPTSRNGPRASYHGQASGDAEAAVQYAYNQIGKPYSFGADGPGSFDCSGLTMAAWRQAGVRLPHSAKQQYYSSNKVDRQDLEPGDLIIFYNDLHHVGIYIGDGQVIHAPQPGESVKVASMSAMPYYGAVRP